jgi:hypothetical protein
VKWHEKQMPSFSLEDWLSQKGSRQTFQNCHCFLCLIKNFNKAENLKNVFCMCLWPRLKCTKRRSNISGSRLWYEMKGLARRNTHVKYESSTKHQSKVMTKVIVFEKEVKLQGQRLEGQSHGLKWKAMPEEIHIWNMKALAPTNQTLWPKIKFFKGRPRSKIRGSRSWYQKIGPARENTHEIWKPYHLPTKVKVFEKVKLHGQRVKVMVSNERSCQKEYTCAIWKPYHLPIKGYNQG